ncbi:aminoglycoside phosphotransferase family protein [Buchananella hordeovulneris]|uniref:phosphotransferase n=1 Tax=Buchananella hordeovulneris TaxID=52770 RepID=UPI000F5FAB80|nr:aminoglycoside phosphotransferase family protein [Buchananella hordeovulneris]RRD43781.1 aminoglycoside phosphotransferase family protein [Buchananella hordeovulneris]
MSAPTTAAVVADILNPATLSARLRRPARVTRLRIKPDVAVIAAVADPAGQPTGWVQAFWPCSHSKLRRADRIAARTGARVDAEWQGRDLVWQWGEIAADPKLATHLPLLEPAAPQRHLLRYNPLRRLVVRDGQTVCRVTAQPLPHVNALTDFLAAHLAIPAPRPLPSGAVSAHASAQAFTGDGDLWHHPTLPGMRAAGTLFAQLHGLAGKLPPPLTDQLPAAALAHRALQGHAALLTHLDPALATRAAQLADRLPPLPAGKLVLSHGDASPDQVLVGSQPHPDPDSTPPGHGARATGPFLDQAAPFGSLSTPPVWLTDFDRACLAPASLDLGSFLSHVSPAAGSAFLAGYRAAGGHLPPAHELATAALHAAALRLTEPLRAGRVDWRAAIGANLTYLEGQLV